ncbi:MAG: hypothetical protein R2824_26130 [Saprospiraceae bacterium]|nr:hypothetical protein [Lewinella sp.]
MNAKNVFLLLLFSFSLFLFTTCKDNNPDTADPSNEELVQRTPIRPSFEQSPPIASDIQIEILDEPLEGGENIRFIATFNEGELQERYLALLLNEEKVVLRDDGQGADQEAGDNRFSIFLKDDPDQIVTELSNRQKLALTTDTLPIFSNRSIRPVEKGNIEGFNALILSQGGPVRIPKDLFLLFPGTSDPGKTLMITDLGVVEDNTRTFNPCTGSGNPNGVWTFGELMRQLASPNSGAIASDAQVSAFVLDWLNTWTVSQVVNGDPLSIRDFQNQIITPWLNASAVAGAPAGQLRMELAPFKLLAIVNRLDLRGNSGYGFSDAGEGRFVFGGLDDDCNSLRFTVIFEYGINKQNCIEIKTFAQEWDALDGLVLGDPAFNTALQNITDQFTLSGTNPGKPNQSSLNQLRTNELLTLFDDWELREFNLTNGGALELTTVKKEPKNRHNGAVGANAVPDITALVSFINSNTIAVENNKYDIPSGLLGGRAPTLNGTSHHWNGRDLSGPMFINSDLARHVFSLNTCSGCHARETLTSFTHISPRPFGIEAGLSGFLTGIDVTDAANRPTGSPTVRHFGDLDRRQNDLNNLLSSTCFSVPRPVFELAHRLTFEPLRMTH